LTEASTKDNFKNENSDDLLTAITETLSRRKAEKIILMDLRNVTTLADYFVVCNGLSDVHVKSLADEVSEIVRDETGEKPWRREGLESRRWVVLDYVNVVVHIFKSDTRDHYGLENMWSDAKITPID
jgi:ribosome-associated protein